MRVLAKRFVTINSKYTHGRVSSKALHQLPELVHILLSLQHVRKKTPKNIYVNTANQVKDGNAFHLSTLMSSAEKHLKGT